MDLAILYESEFEGLVPQSWTRLASLGLSGRNVSVANGTVQFYATDAAKAVLLRERLDAFGKTLPPGVKFEIY